MATKVESRRNLVDTQSAAFIRQVDLTLTLKSARPSTKMHVFFDDVLIDQYAYPSGGVLGDNIISDANGEISIIVELPGGTFTTGTKKIVVADVDDLDLLSTVGSTYGSATGTFTSNGVSERFQTITTTTNIVQYITEVLVLPMPDTGGGDGGGDPLAQSFFTYGVTGGCFLTSIELFFQTKDQYVPVQVELRELINGYPATFSQANPNLIAVKKPADVAISNDASLATKFTFSEPIYLRENADYAFVVYSNSKNYNIFTSRVGETSIETGKRIFEQPYSGSLFRSENNVTWTAEQFEDLKFKLNVAQFNTSVTSNLKFVASAPKLAVPGTWFSTVSGQPTVTLKLRHQHGLEIGSKIQIESDVNGVYNGISAAALDGEFSVLSVPDEYTLTFVAGMNASSTGEITSCRLLKAVSVDATGSGYAANTTLTVTGGGGSGATATPTIVDGKIVSVAVTPGSGYTSTPTITINAAGGGSGASLVAITDAVFDVITNNVVHEVDPLMAKMEVVDTNISATIDTTIANPPFGTATTYTLGKTYPVTLGERVKLDQHSIVASRNNEVTFMGSNYSLRMNVNLSSTNSNVSPVIDTRTPLAARIFGNNLRSSTTVADTELAATGGDATSRYITKRISLKTISNGIRILSSIYSGKESNVDWYVRTSMSGSGVDHSTLEWVKLSCAVERNRSSKEDEYLEYEFKEDNIADFDTYDLKCVLTSTNPAFAPIVKNYRVIAFA